MAKYLSNKSKASRKQDQKNDTAFKPKGHKIKIGFWVFFSILLAVLVGVTILAQDKRSPIWINNHTIRIVHTWSMYPDLPHGTLVVINRLDPDELEVGDDITYFVADTMTFTHRIINIFENYNDSGKRGFFVWGLGNARIESDIVPADRVVGRVVFSIARLSNLTNFINGLINQPIYIVFIGVYTLIFVMLTCAIRGLFSSPDKKTSVGKNAIKKKSRKINTLPKP
jgi:signal peptidase